MCALTKVFLITVFIFVCLPDSILSQAPDTLWTKTYGGAYSDLAYSIGKTNDSGYVFVGHKQTSFFGEPYLWLVRTDDNGDTLWTKKIGDGEGLSGRRVKQLQNNDFIIIGYGNINAINGYFLIKTDEYGDTLWTKFLGDGQIMNNLDLTSDGGFILVGSFYSNISLIKVDSGGDTLWTKAFFSGVSGRGYSVKQCFDKGFIIAGRNANEQSGWLIKTDSLGNIEWDETWNYSGDGTVGYDVIQTKDSNFVMTGFRGGSGIKHIWLVKTDSIGRTYYSKTYSGSNGYSVIESLDKKYVVVGQASGGGNPIKVIKTDTYLDTIWTKVIEDTDLPGDDGDYIKQNPDGSFILLGFVNLSPATQEDVKLIKLKSDVVYVDREYLDGISKYDLSQNYPNPFNPTTIIKYQIPEISFVTIKIYDVLGNEIATLVREEKPIGTYELTWYAENLPSGIYFYRLQAGSFVETKKMVLMK